MDLRKYEGSTVFNVINGQEYNYSIVRLLIVSSKGNETINLRTSRKVKWDYQFEIEGVVSSHLNYVLPRLYTEC